MLDLKDCTTVSSPKKHPTCKVGYRSHAQLAYREHIIIAWTSGTAVALGVGWHTLGKNTMPDSPSSIPVLCQVCCGQFIWVLRSICGSVLNIDMNSQCRVYALPDVHLENVLTARWVITDSKAFDWFILAAHHRYISINILAFFLLHMVTLEQMYQLYVGVNHCTPSFTINYIFT